MTTAYSYIRFSTPDQAKGDSLRRQAALSEAFAKANGLTLDDSLSLLDAGVSAFKSANSATGSLSRFIAAVDSGVVAQGSWLLVESLDRISRADVLTALGLFTQLLQSNITIATLADNRVYTKASVTDNPMDLMASLLIMSRANEESTTKSQRNTAVWEQKQHLAMTTGKPLGGHTLGWLKLSTDKQRYEVIPQRAEVVKRIYELAASGEGKHRIMKQLNASDTPTFGKARMWTTSSVTRILVNESVTGNYQPTLATNGKREPNGPPIQGYYPEVISRSFSRRFNRAEQDARCRARAGNQPPIAIYSPASPVVITAAALCALQGNGILSTWYVMPR